MIDLLTVVTSSATVAGATAGFILWVGRTWISEHIKRAMEFEYAQRLETHKSQLRAENELALERLRLENARSVEVRAAALDAFHAGHLAAHDRRLGAVERLWGAVLKLRKQTPLIIVLTDLFERDKMLHTKSFLKELSELSHDKLMKMMDDASTGIEETRPFVGEDAWALFFASRMLVGRIWIVLQTGRDKEFIPPWERDHGIEQLLRTVLTSEEGAEFQSMRIGSFSWLRTNIESKILQNMRAVISGEESSSFGLKHARDILAAAADLEPRPSAPH